MATATLTADNELLNCWKIIENFDLNKKSNLMTMLERDINNSAMKTNIRSERDVALELAGSWKDNRTADEIVAEIYLSRTPSRLVEAFDD